MLRPSATRAVAWSIVLLSLAAHAHMPLEDALEFTRAVVELALRTDTAPRTRCARGPRKGATG